VAEMKERWFITEMKERWFITQRRMREKVFSGEQYLLSNFGPERTGYGGVWNDFRVNVQSVEGISLGVGLGLPSKTIAIGRRKTSWL
jgi:hypothetical protein